MLRGPSHRCAYTIHRELLGKGETQIQENERGHVRPVAQLPGREDVG